MIELPNITIIAVAGNKQANTISALYKCLNRVKPYKTILLTNIDIKATGIECINVGGLKTWEDYNVFCIKELTKYFQTDMCLLVQWDGYILDETQWDNEFTNYDYVGAKWLDIGKPYNVGNGGFSLRSKRLQDILAIDDFISVCIPEDVSICRVYGQYLTEKYSIKFATEIVADKFSFELNQPTQKTFGFHSFHWKSFKETILFKRSYALGDVLQIEPVMRYFNNKGFNIALDSNDYFEQFFIQHDFKVTPKHKLNPNMPYKEIDLDKSYEINPEQLHLKSYYDFAEVPEEERIYKNPKLSLNFDVNNPENKLFNKYCVIHIDERNQPHRNIYGVNWDDVVSYLEKQDYIVIQLGSDKHEEIKDAIQMKAKAAQFLMWTVGGADLFIGIDSGLSHIASGFDVPSIILSGSVDLKLIHADLSNKIWIHNHDKKVCETPFCWHSVVGGESGKPCIVDEKNPPCVQFKTEQVITAIDKIHLKKQAERV